MWDLPGPGLEPVSPALADGFLTTVPPGKTQVCPYFMTAFLFLMLLYLATKLYVGVRRSMLKMTNNGEFIF